MQPGKIQYVRNMCKWTVSYKKRSCLVGHELIQQCEYRHIHFDSGDAVYWAWAEILNWIHSFIIYELVVDSMVAH